VYFVFATQIDHGLKYLLVRQHWISCGAGGVIVCSSPKALQHDAVAIIAGII
jgi:hypothetical protein